MIKTFVSCHYQVDPIGEFLWMDPLNWGLMTIGATGTLATPEVGSFLDLMNSMDLQTAISAIPDAVEIEVEYKTGYDRPLIKVNLTYNTSGTDGSDLNVAIGLLASSAEFAAPALAAFAGGGSLQYVDSNIEVQSNQPY